MISVSDNFKAAFFGAQTDDVIITLVEITHESLEQDIFLSDDPTQVLSNGERGTISNAMEYQFFPFLFTSPGQDGESIKYASFVVDNISRELIGEIRAIRAPLNIRVKAVLASDPDLVERQFGNMQLRDIKANALVIEGQLIGVRFDTEPYPSRRRDPYNFPGTF